MGRAEPPAPAPRPTGVLQRIPAWTGCVTVTQARQSQEQPPTPPWAGISLVLLSPLLFLSIFHSPCPGLGFSCGISSCSDNKQSPAVTPWCEGAGDGLGNVCGIWDAVGGAAVAWRVPVHGLGRTRWLQTLLPPSSPGVLSVWAPASPFPQGLAQPLRILLPKRSWKTSSQLSRFMKA